MLRSLVRLRPSSRLLRAGAVRSLSPFKADNFLPVLSRMTVRAPARDCSTQTGSGTLGKIDTPKLYLQYTCKVCGHRNTKEMTVINYVTYSSQ